MYWKTIIIVLVVSILSSCAVRRRVDAYNAKVYSDCIKKHGGEMWKDKNTGLPFTCKPLTFPSCEPSPFGGQECHQ